MVVMYSLWNNKIMITEYDKTSQYTGAAVDDGYSFIHMIVQSLK